MLEKLYTRKVVIALMALILAANGLLLYQFQIKPPTQTASTPSSEGSPRVPDTPRQEEEAEAPAGEDDDGEGKNGAEIRSEDEAEGQRQSSEEEPSVEGTPAEEEISPEIPFESQYGSPPTVPGFESASGGGGDPSRVRMSLASFDGPGGGGPDGAGEISILPTTSGASLFPAFVLAGAAAVGVVTIAAFRRR
jgi:hypothetical protein